MYKVVSFLILTFSFIQPVNSQELEWIRMLQGEAEGTSFSLYGDEGQQIAVDNCGYSYVIGFFKDSITVDQSDNSPYLVSLGSTDSYLAKIDESGNVIWTKHFSGPQQDILTNIQVDKQNNIYLIGKFGNGADLNPNEEENIHSTSENYSFSLIRLNSDGQFDWAHNFENTRGMYHLQIVNEHIYVSGYFTTTSGIIDLDPSLDEYIVSNDSGIGKFVSIYNASGKFQSAKIFDDLIRGSAHIDKIGNVYVTGDRSNHFFVHKMDFNGSIEWIKEFDVEGYPESIATDSDNNVYVLGTFTGNGDFNPSEDTFFMESTVCSDGYYGSSIFLLKVDYNGNFLWAHNIGECHEYHDFVSGRSVKVDSKDKVIISGTFSGSFYLGEDYLSDADPEILIGKLEPNGEYLWARHIGGYDFTDFAYNMVIDNHDNILLAGYLRYNVDNEFNILNTPENFITHELIDRGGSFIMKVTDNESVDKYNCQPLGINEEETNGTIYPNPVTRQLNLKLNNNCTNCLISIRNLAGQILQNHVLNNSNRTIIDLEGLSPGLYIINLESKGLVWSTSFIKK